MTFATLKRLCLPLRRKPLPPPPSGAWVGPLGLSREQAEAVVRLASSPAYPAYRWVLERLFEAQQEALIRRLSPEDYAFQCGALTTIRTLAELPESLSQSMRLYDDRTRSARPDDPTGSAGFLNSPWFHGWHGDLPSGARPVEGPG